MTTDVWRIRPLGDYLLVKPCDARVEQIGAIVVPESAQQRVFEGDVLATGPGRRGKDGSRVPMDVHVGDRVVYTEYSGHFVRCDEVEYLLMREEHEVHGVQECRDVRVPVHPDWDFSMHL